MFDNASILVTGGTGSFGNAFLKKTLKEHNPSKIVIFSRDEMKQWEMARKFENNSKVRFMLGDVRDRDRLSRALDGIDYVVHAAAMKIVPKSEYDPFECIKTNIEGAMNLVDICIDRGVKKIVALSTDKACSPSNLYGATKLISDKVFIAGNTYSASPKTIFSVVRYGNVMGSRGSIIPLFLEKSNSRTLPITDLRMTRFMISLQEGIDLVWKAFEDMKGGEIYVKKIKSMKITDVALTINPNVDFEIIGCRPGEKLHEQMINSEDALSTYEYDDYYKIFPSIHHVPDDESKTKGKLVEDGFSYASNSNSEWMTREELKAWIDNHKDEIGII
ncbi:MAG: UDP-N-acetylglucosamine 4,6-dehydratase (inverting) [Prochlorococcus sp. SP3034]|nr:UDP-N-acetylglucosamine 4,6-dehydratase (inverting) [Prochlorococcus sp. SP3034]|tara:strand:+ start:13381 stop:14376 length:996 start_codon:yes stop_codon:yes gene_type:complete